MSKQQILDEIGQIKNKMSQDVSKQPDRFKPHHLDVIRSQQRLAELRNLHGGDIEIAAAIHNALEVTPARRSTDLTEKKQ